MMMTLGLGRNLFSIPDTRTIPHYEEKERCELKYLLRAVLNDYVIIHLS